jgi:hypothetical protein
MCSLFCHSVFCKRSCFVITSTFLRFFTHCIEIVTFRKKVEKVKAKNYIL